MPYFVVVRERSAGWNWSVPMRQQKEWDAHAAFMDAATEEDFIVAGGPLGDEDSACRKRAGHRRNRAASCTRSVDAYAAAENGYHRTLDYFVRRFFSLT